MQGCVSRGSAPKQGGRHHRGTLDALRRLAFAVLADVERHRGEVPAVGLLLIKAVAELRPVAEPRGGRGGRAKVRGGRAGAAMRGKEAAGRRQGGGKGAGCSCAHGTTSSSGLSLKTSRSGASTALFRRLSPLTFLRS